MKGKNILRKALNILICTLLFIGCIMPLSQAEADGISAEISPESAYPGDGVTVTGTAGTEVLFI